MLCSSGSWQARQCQSHRGSKGRTSSHRCCTTTELLLVLLLLLLLLLLVVITVLLLAVGLCGSGSRKIGPDSHIHSALPMQKNTTQLFRLPRLCCYDSCSTAPRCRTSKARNSNSCWCCSELTRPPPPSPLLLLLFTSNHLGLDSYTQAE